MNLVKLQEDLRTQFREEYKITQTQPVMVHIGRIAFEKNIYFLLQITAAIVPRIPNVLLIIAGEGPALKNLK